MSSRPKAVVIGAGISGLATACLLTRDGYQVTVVEKRSHTGGRADYFEQDGFTFETGPSWYLMPELFDHFFKMCGSSAAAELDLVQLDPAYQVFFEGYRDPVTVKADKEATVELFDQLQPGSRKTSIEYLEKAKLYYELARDYFLATNFDAVTPFLKPRILRHLPRLISLLTNSLEDLTTKSFSDHRIRQILGYPAVFVSNDPKRTPALYSLMSHMDLEQGVFYPMGGMRTVIAAIEKIARQHGVEILLETSAEGINVNDGKARSVTVSKVNHPSFSVGQPVGASTTEKIDLPADLVVGACDLHFLETQLLPKEYQSLPESKWQQRDPGIGTVLIMLGVKRKIHGLQHHNLFFNRDWDSTFAKIFDSKQELPDPASIYVCAPSVTDAAQAPAGCENLFILVPVAANPDFGDGNSDQIKRYCEKIIAQIVDMLGDDFRADIVTQSISAPADFVNGFNAWQGSALGPAHTLKQSAFFRGRANSKKVKNLFYAGAFTAPGVGLPMCLYSAQNVIKKLNKDKSNTLLPTPWGTAPQVDNG